MKKQGFLITFALLTLLLIGCQQLTTPQSQAEEPEAVLHEGISLAEQFCAKTGVLIQKEYYTIGQVGMLMMEVINCTNLDNNDKISALRMDFYSPGRSIYSTSNPKATLLDADEIGSFIDAVKTIHNNILGTGTENYTEYIYKSRGGFQAGCCWTEESGIWRSYVKLSPSDEDSYVFFEPEDLTLLLTQLEQAKAKMQ